MILGRQLRSLGFDVVEAEDGQAALAKIREQGPFVLALVDWNMPVMNGIELVRALRKDRALDSLQIMMVTTETEPEQISCALAAGANEYLMKPFTAETVADKLGLLGLRGAA
jgi:two-component system chemotaxis response regulator CheY